MTFDEETTPVPSADGPFFAFCDLLFLGEGAFYTMIELVTRKGLFDMAKTENYMLSSIGHVSTTVTEKSYQNWGEIESKIVLDAEYQEGLLGLEGYSHLLVIFYMHNFRETTSDKVWARQPRGRSDMPHVGVFAQRTKYRPNPLGITAVKLVSIEANVLTVKGLDANDGTPVLDIKPYVPEFDRVMDTKIPDWMSELMHHYF